MGYLEKEAVEAAVGAFRKIGSALECVRGALIGSAGDGEHANALEVVQVYACLQSDLLERAIF